MIWEPRVKNGVGQSKVWQDLEAACVDVYINLYAGQRADGSWVAYWTLGPGFINIDVDNMEDAKATAIALYRMR